MELKGNNIHMPADTETETSLVGSESKRETATTGFLTIIMFMFNQCNYASGYAHKHR